MLLGLRSGRGSYFEQSKKTTSVIHVVENLDRRAVENWLLRMLGHARKQGEQVD